MDHDLKMEKKKKEKKKKEKKKVKKEDIPGRNTKQIVTYIYIYIYYFLQSFKKVTILFIM